MQAMGTRSDSTGKNWVKRGLNLHLPLFFCQKCCKPVSNIYSGSRDSSSNKAVVGVDYLGADILNSASRILQCWSYYVKINSARHQHDTKQSGIVAINSCFVLFGARQYGVTTRDQALMKKYPRTLILVAFIKLEPWGSWAVSISLSPKLSVWKISCRTKSVGKRILAQNIGPRITGDAVSILLRSSVPRRGYMRRTGHNPKKWHYVTSYVKGISRCSKENGGQLKVHVLNFLKF